MKREEKLSDVLNKELELLSQETAKNALTTDIKKVAFAENVKNDVGKTIISQIDNPDRHNPKKLSFWVKFKKALGC